MSLKKTSETIVISSSLSESGASTFTTEEVDLQLDPLNNEVFVITAIDIDLQGVNLVATKNTAVNASISTVSRTTVGGINNNNVLAAKRISIRADAANAVSFESMSPDTPVMGKSSWTAILATNNFFLNIEGSADNTGVGSMQTRIWGYRSKATAATYAALVQSELLSS